MPIQIKNTSYSDYRIKQMFIGNKSSATKLRGWDGFCEKTGLSKMGLGNAQQKKAALNNLYDELHANTIKDKQGDEIKNNNINRLIIFNNMSKLVNDEKDVNATNLLKFSLHIEGNKQTGLTKNIKFKINGNDIITAYCTTSEEKVINHFKSSNDIDNEGLILNTLDNNKITDYHQQQAAEKIQAFVRGRQLRENIINYLDKPALEKFIDSLQKKPNQSSEQEQKIFDAKKRLALLNMENSINGIKKQGGFDDNVNITQINKDYPRDFKNYSEECKNILTTAKTNFDESKEIINKSSTDINVVNISAMQQLNPENYFALCAVQQNVQIMLTRPIFHNFLELGILPTQDNRQLSFKLSDTGFEYTCTSDYTARDVTSGTVMGKFKASCKGEINIDRDNGRFSIQNMKVNLS